MAKIAMLKAYILQMHLAFKDLTMLAVQSMLQDLQDWHDGIPPKMHLDTIGREGITLETKRTIYHVHLLYLGANMLLFRRIASPLVRSLAFRIDRDILWRPCEKLLREQSERALLAATSSARIAKLLLDENGVFKRC